ncbi:MAG: DNA/RNA helicase domain-containing protein, partial [Burkholderiaceae bacterium]
MEERALYERYGWRSNLESFHRAEPRVVRLQLQRFIADASPEQIRAWDQSIPWLQRECRELEARDSAAREYTAILEYELPRDSRRPDVIVLERGCVAVLELKGALHASRAALDQAFGYARDLRAYHAACADRLVTPVLLIRGGPRNAEERDGVYVVAPDGLDHLLDRLSVPGEDILEIEAFLAPDAYAPLPSIVQAARELFHRRELPMIKRARAATDPALQYISSVAQDAASTKTRHVVLLSGVPGSGKTLVGLQLVHAHWLDDLAVPRANGRSASSAVYLSGNGPLVQVLQDALKDAGGGGKTFVQGIKEYVRQHSRPGRPVPPEHLIVFDEAQRAWDAERVARGHKSEVSKSEPEYLIEFCERIPEWCVLVALIGDGQAIHVGEEAGIALWHQALLRSKRASEWTVHGAPAFSTDFQGLRGDSSWNEVLNLDTELRFHFTPRVHKFVAGLLDGAASASLRSISDELNEAGHRFLVTRDLGAARGYLRERYADAKYSRFGLIASSKDKWLPEFDVDNTFQTTKQLRVGPWYNADPIDAQSCCQLTSVATEFSSQGLELDCALLAWGSDYVWRDEGWSIEYSGKNRPPLKDPVAVRKNVYRVLLTRGRDGTVIYVPRHNELDATFEHLR